jgi:hypothetical protein
MKKNQNIKIHPGYKAAVLATLIGIVAGCKRYEHDNVVVGIQNVSRPNMVLIRDLQDGNERMVVFNDQYDAPILLRVGDTVTIGIYSDNLYRKYRVLDRRYQISFKPKQSCIDRTKLEQEMSRLNALKQEMQNANTK